MICISSTGSGKTLTFWIPLLFRDEIHPIEYSKSTECLSAWVPAIAISGENARTDNFQVIHSPVSNLVTSIDTRQDIGRRKYHIVIMNPEQAPGVSIAALNASQAQLPTSTRTGWYGSILLIHQCSERQPQDT